MSRWIEPVGLKGEHVVLEPLEQTHASELIDAAKDGELWKLWFTSVPSPETVGRYIDAALAMREHEGAMPFAVIEPDTGSVVGSTRFFNVAAQHRRLEIGYTWYAKRCQRTAINTEAKLLLLEYAFENRGAIAVEFRTHWHNHRSREAITRLGAKLDGVLRNHMILPDGTLRDTAVYSIIDAEWPTVKRSLQYKLGRD